MLMWPNNAFQKQASKVTGLHLGDGCLYNNKKHVEAVSSKDGITSDILCLS